MHLELLQPTLCVCRLNAADPVPEWAAGSFFCLTRTPDELSLVCEQSLVPDQVVCERNWRTLKIRGPLDFSLVGVLSSVLEPLAAAGVSIFAVSTYQTDYVLVKEENLGTACNVLREAGHRVTGLEA